MAELAGFEHRSDGVVDAEELMVLTEDFYQPSFVLGEQSEILDQIEQAAAVAGPSQHDFEGDTARFVFAFDAFPLEEPFSISGQ